MEKSKERLKILERIDEFERAERWDEDVEDDPETIELLPHEIDYLNKKLSSKIKSWIANFLGTRFFEKMIKQGALRIKEVRGIENFKAVKKVLTWQNMQMKIFICFITRLSQQRLKLKKNILKNILWSGLAKMQDSIKKTV